MCLLIVEVLMLITGVWSLISGALPAGLFKLLFGKGEYKTDPRHARLFGLLLASPIPITFLGGLILGVLFGSAAVQYTAILEFFIVVVVSILAVMKARKIKNQPLNGVI